MNRFEYKEFYFQIGSEEHIEALNALGLEGWEAVCNMDRYGQMHIVLLLKRTVRDE